MINNGSFFRMIRDFDKQGYLMSASTPGEDLWTETGGPAEEGGLVPGHAYSVIQAIQTKEGVQLLQIRNPWGSFEWSGDYSDNHPSWT